MFLNHAAKVRRKIRTPYRQIADKITKNGDILSLFSKIFRYKTGERPAKRNTRNQKQFEKLIIMQHGEVKLTVGLQRSNQDMVQYCITVPRQQQSLLSNKATTEE